VVAETAGDADDAWLLAHAVGYDGGWFRFSVKPVSAYSPSFPRVQSRRNDTPGPRPADVSPLSALSTTSARRVSAVTAATGALLLTQYVVAGTFMRLFDGATADIVPGVVPWILFAGYAGALLAVGGWACHRYGWTGVPLGFGLLVIVAASIPFGGGCEVAGTAGPLRSLLPRPELRGLSLVLHSGTGCTYPVVVPLLAAGYALGVGGLAMVTGRTAGNGRGQDSERNTR
jgi:hypothetical protein